MTHGPEHADRSYRAPGGHRVRVVRTRALGESDREVTVTLVSGARLDLGDPPPDPLAFSADGRYVYQAERGAVGASATFTSLDTRTGQRAAGLPVDVRPADLVLLSEVAPELAPRSLAGFGPAARRVLARSRALVSAGLAADAMVPGRDADLAVLLAEMPRFDDPTTTAALFHGVLATLRCWPTADAEPPTRLVEKALADWPSAVDGERTHPGWPPWDEPHPAWRLIRVASLHLRGRGLGDAGCLRLATSPWLPPLLLLDLEDNGIGDEGARSLARWPGLAGVHELRLPRNAIGDVGAEALADSAVLGELRTLSLFDNRVGDRGALALLRSPHLVALERLNLRENALTPPTERTVAAALASRRPAPPAAGPPRPAAERPISAAPTGEAHDVDDAIRAGTLEAPDTWGRTPLFLAVLRDGGCAECVRRLLRAGADPNRRARDGSSLVDALHAGVSDAIGAEKARAIEVLLRAAGFRDRTLTLERHERCAVELRDDEVVWTVTVGAPAAPEGGGAEGVRPAPATTQTLRQGHDALVRLGPPIALPREFMAGVAAALGRSGPLLSEPLPSEVRHLLAWSHHGRTAAVEALLADGVPVDACDGAGCTALLEAIRGGHSDTALALLRAGAGPSRATEDGVIPLAAAAATGLAEVVLALLDAGAAVDQRTVGGSTPLLAACARRPPDARVVEWLLAAGADADATDDRGRRGLMLAAEPETLALLADAGADVEARDPNGWTALMHHAAQGDGAPQVVALLAAGASVQPRPGSETTALHLAVHARALETVAALLTAGAPVDALDARGHTPLRVAVEGRAGAAGIVDALLGAGASVERRDREGLTPLLVAAGHDLLALLEPLVRAGADPDACDPGGRTALIRCAARGREATLWELHRLGADPRRRDASGRSALDVASAANRAVLDWLLK